jgi:transposase-like protein
MRKPYQIQSQRAVLKFGKWVAEQSPAVQLILPLAHVVAMLQEGVGHLLREAGVELMGLIMQEEARQLAGERHRPNAERRAWRWGQEQGYGIVDGQKVPLKRPRLRNAARREERLGSYELFRRGAPLEQNVWEKLLCGLSTRNYGPVTRQFAEAYGIDKSVVSERFIQVSRAKLQELLERPLGDLPIAVVVVDGTEFKEQHLVVALGISKDGRKMILGLHQGATENTTVSSALLADMERRGFDFRAPRLYVLDGNPALEKAVRRHAGEAALIQRCQAHKKRNILEHLSEEDRPAVKRQLEDAYGQATYGDAKRALERLQRQLHTLNPSAARSLAEGLEETLTVHRLQVPELLRRSLATTNVIESTFSVVETVCRNVKRWRRGDHRQRWVASGLLVAERKFRRVRGHRHMPRLLEALAAEAGKKGLVQKAKSA